MRLDAHEIRVLGELRVDGALFAAKPQARAALVAMAVAFADDRADVVFRHGLSGGAQTAVRAALPARVEWNGKTSRLRWKDRAGVTVDLAEFRLRAAVAERALRAPVTIDAVRDAVERIAPIVLVENAAAGPGVEEARRRHGQECRNVAALAVVAARRVGDEALVARALAALGSIDPAAAEELTAQAAQRGGADLEHYGAARIVTGRARIADRFARDTLFGRADVAAVLADARREVAEADRDRDATAVALTGPPRVGKSRLSAEGVRAADAADWPVAAWCDGRRLDALMLDLAAQLGIATAGRTPEGVRPELQRALEDAAPWCIALDGVDPARDEIAAWWQGVRGGLWLFSAERADSPPGMELSVHRVAELDEQARMEMLAAWGVPAEQAEALAHEAPGLPEVLRELAVRARRRGAADPQQVVADATRAVLGAALEDDLAALPPWTREALALLALFGEASVPLAVWRAIAVQAGGPDSPSAREEAVDRWTDGGEVALPRATALLLAAGAQARPERAAAALADAHAAGTAPAATLVDLARRLVRGRGARAGVLDRLPADVHVAVIEAAAPGKLADEDLARVERLCEDEPALVARVAELARRRGRPESAVALIDRIGAAAQPEAAAILAAALQDTSRPESLPRLRALLDEGHVENRVVLASAWRTVGQPRVAAETIEQALRAFGWTRRQPRLPPPPHDPALAHALLLASRTALDCGDPGKARVFALDAHAVAVALVGERGPLALDALAHQAETWLWQAELFEDDRSAARAEDALSGWIPLDDAVPDVAAAWRVAVAARIAARVDPRQAEAALASMDRSIERVEAERPRSVMEGVLRRHRLWLRGDTEAALALDALPPLVDAHPELAWRAVARGDCLRASDPSEARRAWAEARSRFRALGLDDRRLLPGGRFRSLD